MTLEEEAGREGVAGLKRRRKLHALTPGAAASEKTVHGSLITMVSMAHLAGMFRESADQR